MNKVYGALFGLFVGLFCVAAPVIGAQDSQTSYIELDELSSPPASSSSRSSILISVAPEHQPNLTPLTEAKRTSARQQTSTKILQEKKDDWRTRYCGEDSDCERLFDACSSRTTCSCCSCSDTHCRPHCSRWLPAYLGSVGLAGLGLIIYAQCYFNKWSC